MIRLKYTIAQLDKLSTSSLHVAFSAELHRQLCVPPPRPGPPLKFAIEVKKYIQHLYTLCRVIGCHNLKFSSVLEELPGSVKLLDSVYLVSQTQFQPALKALIWQLLVSILEPWMVQFNRMLGHQLAPALMWDHPEVYIADMFVAKQNMRFVAVKSKIPTLLPSSVAQLAVEALNCRLVLGLEPVRESAQVPAQICTQSSYNRSADTLLNIWADKTEKTYTPPHAPQANLHPPQSGPPPQDIPYEVSQMFRDVYTVHLDLNKQVCTLLDTLLVQEIVVIKQLFLLQDGILWLMLGDLLETRPGESQIAQVNHHVARVCPAARLVYQTQPSECWLQVEYIVPPQLASIVTVQLVSTLQRAFARLLALQRQYRADNNPAELGALSMELGRAAADLRVCSTLESTVQLFALFNENLCSLIDS